MEWRSDKARQWLHLGPRKHYVQNMVLGNSWSIWLTRRKGGDRQWSENQHPMIFPHHKAAWLAKKAIHSTNLFLENLYSFRKLACVIHQILQVRLIAGLRIGKTKLNVNTKYLLQNVLWPTYVVYWHRYIGKNKTICSRLLVFKWGHQYLAVCTKKRLQ